MSPTPTQGNLVDLHENILREVPYDPNHEGPIYTGPLEVLGPGFAPFKPYLRPPFFHFRVSVACVSIIDIIMISCDIESAVVVMLGLC